MPARLHAGKSVCEVASNVHLTSKAVREIGRRYEDSGLERALYDKQRPGAQSLLDAKQRQRIIAMVCSDPLEGRAPLDRPVDRGRTGETQSCATGAKGRAGNDADPSPQPRVQTVAEKNVVYARAQ